MNTPNLKAIHGSRQLAGRVGRWHTWPMIRRPTSAEHCARVATIYCELWGIPRGEVLYFILHHDSGELLAGDTPYWAKRYNAVLAKAISEVEVEGLRRLQVTLPKLSEEEFKKFKCADILEMYETSEVELNMGNRYAEVPLNGCYDAALQLGHDLGKAHVVCDWISGCHRADKVEES